MKGKLGFLALFGITFFSLTVAFTATIAWFSSVGFTFDNNRLSGKSQGAYFAYGTGTAEDPYGITNTRHLNNLAWLQYSGYFNNKDQNNDGTPDRFHFELAANVNEKGSTYVMPPIGTETYPFTGVFTSKGDNNYVINNIKITNDESAFNNKPAAIDFADDSSGAPAYATDKAEIVGFFGVIGDNEGDNYSTPTPSISNFTLNNITVQSKTEKTLIGLAAGYIDADMSNVNVDGDATIDVNGQTAKNSNLTNKLSDYGLVGYTTHKATNSSNSYSQKLSEYYQDGEETPGEGDDWGGSINTKSYNEWIYDSFKYRNNNNIEVSSMVGSNNADNVISNDYYNLTFRTASVTDLFTSGSDTKKKQYRHYANPNTFDEPTKTENPHYQTVDVQIKSVVYQLKDNCYLPLRFKDSSRTETHKNNSGYIIGCDNPSNNRLGSPKMASGFTVNLQNSLSNTKVENSSYPGYTWGKGNNIDYVDSKLEVLTYNHKTSSWCRIKDSHNSNNNTTNGLIKDIARKTVDELGFEKYNASRNQLQTILSSANRIQGIHFEYSEVGMDNILTVPSNIKINGNTYSNYDLPMGSVDFNIKKTGYVNFFASTFYLSSTNARDFSFFTLNQIVRNGSKITNILKIDKIYLNKYWNSQKLSNSITNPKYFYKYSNGTYSNIVVNGSTRAATVNDTTSTDNQGNTVSMLAFDVGKVLEGFIGVDNGATLKQAVNNLMFYFEVPVNDGEYAMGMPPAPVGIQNTHTGAYLIYLDIGANGDTVNSDKIHAYSITTKTGGNSYPVGVDFIPIDVAGNGGESISISINAGKTGIATFVVNDNDITVTDTSTICLYAYRSSNYISENPTDTQFTCNLPGAPPSMALGGERVLTINLVTTEDDEYTIRITDKLSNDAGAISSSSYEVDSGSGFAPSTEVAIEGLSEAINLDDLRSLTTVATLTRSSGTGVFVVTYDEENCSYDNTTIDVDIVLNGTAISIMVAEGYTFKIGGTDYTNIPSYPAQ